MDDGRRVREREHEVTEQQEEEDCSRMSVVPGEKALDMLSFTCSHKHLNLGDSLLQRLHTFRGSLAEGEVLGAVRARAWGAIARQRLQSRFNVQLKLQESIIQNTGLAFQQKQPQTNRV